MIEKRPRIDEIGIKVLLVAYDEPSLLDAKILMDLENPYELLLDREKKFYREWGMGRTTRRESFLSPVLTLRYIGLMLKGAKFLGFAPDMLQLGGDFILDTELNISFSYKMKNNGDRAEVDRLISEAERVAYPQA